MVPKDWKTLSLSEITKEKISYGIVQAGPHVENGVSYIKSSNVGGEIKIEDLQRTSSEIHHKYRRSAVHPNDIVFSLRGNIGRTSIVPPELLEANLTQGTARISVNTKNETNFVYYSLASTPILNRINSLSKGSTFKEISLEELRKVKLPIPPLPEQQKIAKILSTWDKAISTTERLIDNSTQQKKAVMQQLLTGKKRLVGFDEEWISEPLENVVGKIYGGGTPSKNVSEYWDGDIPWVTVKDLIATKIDGAQQYINKSGLESSSANMVPAGTVIIATRMALGKAVIASCDVAINQDLKAITGSPKIDSVFLHYWLLLQAKAIEKLGTGSTVKGVQLETIKSLRMYIPSSIQEQQKIATVLTNADKEIELLEQQLADLQQEKKALMQVLLTGKKRVVV